jgi:prepilin-type processing-associated H-X9-DG protein
MKQIGLALINYHDARQILPAATKQTAGEWNWAPMVLPFIEDQQTYKILNFKVDSWQAQNFAVLQAVHPNWICPSDPNGTVVIEEESFAAPTWSISQSDYASCQGNYMNSTGLGQTPQFGNVTNSSGAFDAVPVLGMMSRFGWSARFKQVTDGLSHTIMVGECVGAWCITQNWGCESFATTAHPINWQNEKYLLESQIQWPTQANPDWDDSIGFRSLHPGGANFCLGDGSVKFLTDDLDPYTYMALASIRGGETLDENSIAQ